MPILLLFAWKGDVACIQNCMNLCILERISTTVSGNDDLTLLIRLCSTIHDNSLSEDFIRKVARQSRGVAFQKKVKTIINAYQVKAKIVIDKFQKRHRQPRAEKKTQATSCLGLGAGEEVDNESQISQLVGDVSGSFCNSEAVFFF